MQAQQTSIDTDSLEDRAKFGFPVVVRSEFAFLTNFGFRYVKTEPTFVRFESNWLVVNVYHGRKSCRLGAEIGLLDSPDGEDPREYSLVALIQLTDPEEAERYRNFIALTRGAVRTGVDRLAEVFKAYAWDALCGDPTIFSKLEEQRLQSAHRRATEYKAKHVRPKAATAFRDKNYKEAVRLYESIQNELTEAELKKLEYAYKHAS